LINDAEDALRIGGVVIDEPRLEVRERGAVEQLDRSGGRDRTGLLRSDGRKRQGNRNKYALEGSRHWPMLAARARSFNENSE
jgi:hypothetical protein